MLEKGKTYAYFYEADKRGNDVTITNVSNGIAMAISESWCDMSFAMHFDASSGEGLNDYLGTHLEELS